MEIKGLGNVAMPVAGRAGGPRPAFSMGDAAATGSLAKTAGPAALGGLLLLQEATDAPARDRRARQHGRALLDALARLQLGLLGGHPGTHLQELAGLAESCPEASDPALKDTLDAIVLRARVELARQEL